MECQAELDTGNPFSFVFLKEEEVHSTQTVKFWIYWSA
jgi:hypothetical protein